MLSVSPWLGGLAVMSAPAGRAWAEEPSPDKIPDEISGYVRQFWVEQSQPPVASLEGKQQQRPLPLTGFDPHSGEEAQFWSGTDRVTGESRSGRFPGAEADEAVWDHRLLPVGIVYRNYLAGEKESRLRSVWAYRSSDGWIWDITLGGRVGLYRFGTGGEVRPQGWQIDVEGAGFPRLDLEQERDLVSADFRAGVPITYGTDRYQVKLAYYHLSSHVGDEFLLRNPGFPRLNYSRDVLVNGYSLQLAEPLRVYGEIGWAFASDISEPWELQFGVEYSPEWRTGARGSPFAAVATHLREEVDFGGNLVVQAGWAWRGSPASGLLRFGFQYFDGQSDQFSFFDQFERKVGLGLWYDF
jgi:hypothetical protein